MARYILRRLALIVPTLLGIILINFVIVQFAPGGPIEQIIASVTAGQMSATAGISGGGDTAALQTSAADSTAASYGLDPELLKDLERQFGFDRPAHERFLTMVWNYIRFDFGTSYFQDRPVVDLVIERLPVSISLGLWSLLLIYGISIPLGIVKAVRDGSRFDIWTSTVIFVGYAVPGFLFAILLIVVFAGGNYFDVFPLRGLVSENWRELSWPRPDRGLLLAPDPADHLAHRGRLRDADDAHQELLPRGDRQAVRADGPGPRASPRTACSTGTCSATRC